MKKIPTEDVFFTKRYVINGKKIKPIDNQYKSFQFIRSYQYLRRESKYGIDNIFKGIEDGVDYPLRYVSYYMDGDKHYGTYAEIEDAINIRAAFPVIEFKDQLSVKEILKYEKIFNIIQEEMNNLEAESKCCFVIIDNDKPYVLKKSKKY